MHTEKFPVPARSALVEKLSTVLPAYEPVLLRMSDSFPYQYGYLVYEDPYVDYVTVRLLGLESAVWSGTREDFYRKWEPSLPTGVS
jgi:hypothetical protein